MSPTSDPNPPALIDRRHFIRGALVIGAGLAAEHFPLSGEAYARGVHKWSNPRTWGGRVPGRNTVVRITKPVLLDRDVRVAGVVIKRGGALIFHPNKRVTLSSSGNVIVEGLLRMRPRGPRDRHTLKFVGIKERRFRGGGVTPLRSDVGLWVVGGVLDLRGSNKRAWTRVAGGISRGAKSIKLRRDASGWRVGDTIVIAPTLPPSTNKHAEAFDRATITGINGRTIQLSRATRFAHPSVEVAPGRVMRAEVLNLTRNVAILGTPRGRSHIKITSHRKQKIRNVDIRYMGPRKKDGKFTEKILGRWPLHFHHCHNGSRGSLVKGVVVRDSGSHAFVPHASHGITFSDCIAYNNLETAYWWDEPTKKDPSLSHDIVFKSCVAALIQFDPPHQGGTSLKGFLMAQGRRNKCISSVAVGVLGQDAGDSGGYAWRGVWRFRNCVSHNNKNLGGRFWENHPNPHIIDNFVSYHNGTHGVLNGAYGNSVDYVKCVFHANRTSQVHAKATSKSQDVQRFIGCSFDSAGLANFCIEFPELVNVSHTPIVIKDCAFKGARKAALGFINDTEVDTFVDVLDCTFKGNEFWLSNRITTDSVIRIRDPLHSRIELRSILHPMGVPNPNWNAKVIPS